MKYIYIDFETYSDVDIALGPTAYVNGKDFRPVRMAYSIDWGKIDVVTDFSSIPDSLIKVFSSKSRFIFVAHNAPFDVAVFEKVWGHIKISEFVDTAALCRYYSVPASLDNAGAFFNIGQKLPAGKALLSKLKSGAELTKKELAELAKYNRQDVKLLRYLHKIFLKYGEFDPFTQKVFDLNCEMNRGGIAVDQARATRLLSEINRIKGLFEEEAKKQFGTFGKNGKAIASSAAQVKKYLASKGHNIDSIEEKDLEDFLTVSGSKLPAPCVKLLSYYREIQSRGDAKLKKIVANKITRIYDSSIFHGAHTGRPSGGGIQLLNVKRYAKKDDKSPFGKSIKRIITEAETGETVKRLSSLFWGALVPDKESEIIFRSDLSAIEPRVAAWLRADERILDIYRNADVGTGKDEYTIFGESMNFPEEILRDLSKIAILSAGYGMGAERYRYQVRSWGLPDPGAERANQILEGYHRRNPSVKQLWFRLVKGAVSAIETGLEQTYWQTLRFSSGTIKGKKFLFVHLPSGRIKSYADVRIEVVGQKGWKTFSYLDPVKQYRQTMRPAMLYENIVQAIAVDVSFAKALEINKFAKVKLNIYDELNISTNPKHVEKIKKIMNAPVSWLPGMPVAAKTVVCSSFHKGDLVK